MPPLSQHTHHLMTRSFHEPAPEHMISPVAATLNLIRDDKTFVAAESTAREFQGAVADRQPSLSACSQVLLDGRRYAIRFPQHYSC